MIDTTKEKPVALLEARNLSLFPRPPALTTLLRWIRHGHDGVKLESGKSGRTIYTSVEAIQRFQDRLSGVPAGQRTPSEATVAQAAAARALDALGIK